MCHAYITSWFTQGFALSGPYTLKEVNHYRNVGLNLCRSQRYIHYQNLRVHTCRSFHIRHLVLAILVAVWAPLSTCLHGCSLHCHQRPIPPRRLVFHFPNTSGIPTYNFHLTIDVGGVEVHSSNYLSSGTPNFKVQDRVEPTVFYTLSQTPITAPFP